MNMKNLLAIGLAATLLGMSSMSAVEREKKELCDWEDGLTIHADWLYWKARRSGLDFAIPGTAVGGGPQGTLKSVSPKFDHGFRIGLFKDFGEDSSVGLRYLIYKNSSSQSQRKSPAELLATRNHPGALGAIVDPLTAASSEFGVDYNVLTLEVHHSLDIAGERGAIKPLAGLVMHFLDQRFKTVYTKSTNLTATIKENLDATGYGVLVGFEGTYEICGAFGFLSRFVTGLAITDFTNKWLSQVNAGGSLSTYVDVKKSFWLIIPNWEVQLGLTYDLSDCFCSDWNLVFGYEMRNYCCMPDFIHWVDDNAIGNMTRNGSNIGFDGIFLRIIGTF